MTTTSHSSRILVIGFCLLFIRCNAEENHFTTMTSLPENQVIPSKDSKLVDSAWSWSQPEVQQIASSIFPETQTLPQNIVSSYYLPGQNFNHQGSTAQRAEYFPYPYEIGPAEDSHHVSAAQSTENAIGSITKHFAIVSFIGLLLLFAIVQNSMSASKRKDALMDILPSRRKREVVMIHGLDDPMTPEQAEVLREDAKVRCMQLTLCLENRKLRKHFGTTGKLIAKYLTRMVKNSVERTSGWDRLLKDAGQAGLRGEDCRILYRDCSPSDLPKTKN